jgi:hypothetical protein
MPNENVFAYQNLPSAENPSPYIVYNHILIAPTHFVLWTPQTGKRIFLTGIEISAELQAIVPATSFERAGNSIFLVARFGTTSPTPSAFVQTFFSPLQFNVNESISVTSALTLIDITLCGYEA